MTVNLWSRRIASDRNQPRKYIEWVLAVVASVERRPVQRVVTEVDGLALAAAFRRGRVNGPDGLLRDKRRKPGKPPIHRRTVRVGDC
jgi:hypothetical protein